MIIIIMYFKNNKNPILEEKEEQAHTYEFSAEWTCETHLTLGGWPMCCWTPGGWTPCTRTSRRWLKRTRLHDIVVTTSNRFILIIITARRVHRHYEQTYFSVTDHVVPWYRDTCVYYTAAVCSDTVWEPSISRADALAL